MITPWNSRETPPFQYFYHVSDRSVQCAIGTKNPETTVTHTHNPSHPDCHASHDAHTKAQCTPQGVYRPPRFESHRLSRTMLTQQCTPQGTSQSCQLSHPKHT